MLGERIPSLPSSLKWLVSITVRRDIGRQYALWRRRATGRTGERRLIELYPGFHLTEQDREAWSATLSPAHQQYVGKISSESWAMSLEQAIFLGAFCDLTKPTRVLDLGSGLSSYVLRRYGKNADNTVDVYSVDSDADWLTKTAAFIQSRDLADDNLQTWTQFSSVDHASFDVVYFDIASTELRLSIFDQAVSLCREGGLFLIDDCHSPVIRQCVLDYVDRSNCDVLSLYNWTLDRFGRYAIALVPKT